LFVYAQDDIKVKEHGVFMVYGTIFNIQKCSIHDGDGLRTTVFFKGCPLKCIWCANPESQDFKPEIASFYSRCIGCGKCIAVCPEKCIVPNAGRYEIDYEKCDKCEMCVDNCYAESKRVIGSIVSADYVLDEVLKDKRFYEHSNGGVTFSGGEPLMQPFFLLELARKCKNNSIKLVLETCGYGDCIKFMPALEYMDMIYFDLKHANENIHRKLTGESNRVILDNLYRIDKLGIKMIIRIPIIPGYNDDTDNLSEISHIVSKLNSVREVELLAYHNLGESKYDSLGRKYDLKGLNAPDESLMMKYVACFISSSWRVFRHPSAIFGNFHQFLLPCGIFFSRCHFFG
jgi:pyruvate formate lyase activating enzyme